MCDGYIRGENQSIAARVPSKRQCRIECIGLSVSALWPMCSNGAKLLQATSKKFQHICVSLDVNFNESLTNDIVSFEQLGPG